MKRYVLIGLAIFVVAGFAIFFFTRRSTGWIEVTAVSETPNNVAVQVTIDTDKGPETFELKPSETKKIRIEPGLTSVRGVAGDIKAIDSVQVNQSETTKLTTPLGQQRDVSLLGKEARYCPLVVGGSVYSYNCRGEGAIIEQNAPNNSVLFGGQMFSLAQPHKNGLLTFSPADQAVRRLEYVDLATRTINPVQLPVHVQELLASEIPLVVTPDQEPNPSRFALMFRQANKVYVFNDTGDQNPVTVQPANNTTMNGPSRTSSGSFYGDRFVLYLGADEHAAEGAELNELVQDPGTVPAAFLFEYAADGSLASTINLPENFFANSMYRLSGDYYVANWTEGSLVYFYQNDTLKTVYEPGYILKWATYHDKIYIQEEISLYEFVPGSNGLFNLHGVFSSHELRLSKVFTTSKGVAFTAFVTTTDSQPLNIYLLSDQLAGPGSTVPGITPVVPIQFQGIDDLLTYGVTTEQVDALKVAFNNYAQSSGKSIGLIHIKDIAPVSRDRFSPNPANSINFTVAAGDETTKATMEYLDLYKTRLILYGSDNQQIYDSGMITAE